MQWFYSNSEVISDILILSPTESHHCVRVLRMQEGGLLITVDGRGNYYKCKIKNANPRACELQVLEHNALYGEKPYRLHIAIAPTKSNERMEWFLEKATEIGVDEITPLLCDFSERKIIKHERMQRVLESAMKQSQQAYLPALNPIVKYSDFVPNVKADVKCIAWCGEHAGEHLKMLTDVKKDILVLIGPEGDFSPQEIKLALDSDFVSTSLGNTRLRTETAGVIACSIVSTISYPK